MAKKRASIGGNLQEQIDRLKKSVGRAGIAQSKEILATYDVDVIKLAFKTLPKSPAATVGLGKRIETLLKNVPKSKQAEMREMLLRAKSK